MIFPIFRNFAFLFKILFYCRSWWGLAGIKKENKIIVTKIPKSGNLVEYLEETDPKKKRSFYCHCPRVRDALKTPGVKISPTYCYCGAGFYEGIWEEILENLLRLKF